MINYVNKSMIESLFRSASNRSIFIISVLFYNTCIKNTSMIISKNDSNSVFNNILHKYKKKLYSINKLLKSTFIITIKYYNNPKFY